MSDDERFYAGEVVFDKKRTDPTDDLLIVTDANVGVLGDLSGEKYRMVKHNDTNQQLRPGANAPVDDTTRLIEAAYISDSGTQPAVIGSKRYTFPEWRLETVVSEDGSALDGLQPHQLALATFYGELARALAESETTVETPKDLKVLAMQAAVDGKVILRGEELAAP